MSIRKKLLRVMTLSFVLESDNMLFSKFKTKHPIISFMLIVKIYWLSSFFFSIYVIQGEIPTLRQFLLGSMFAIITLPLNYWLTYSFGSKGSK